MIFIWQKITTFLLMWKYAKMSGRGSQVDLEYWCTPVLPGFLLVIDTIYFFAIIFFCYYLFLLSYFFAIKFLCHHIFLLSYFFLSFFFAIIIFYHHNFCYHIFLCQPYLDRYLVIDTWWSKLLRMEIRESWIWNCF